MLTLTIVPLNMDFVIARKRLNLGVRLRSLSLSGISEIGPTTLTHNEMGTPEAGSPTERLDSLIVNLMLGYERLRAVTRERRRQKRLRLCLSTPLPRPL